MYIIRKFKWYIHKIITLFYKIYSPKKGIKNSNNKPRIIISLTSFPARLDTLHLDIKSLLNQKMKPDKIILYLGTDVSEDMIPQNLIKLQKAGLEIKTGYDDIKPHKKYYYAMKEYPDDIIITVDDDVIYHRDLVSELIKAYHQYPDCVICRRGRRISYDDNNKLLPYNCWPLIKESEGPTLNILPTGVGGILYPPHCLHEDVFDKNTFIDICLRADDIWLKFMQVKNGTNVVFIKSKYGEPIIIPSTLSSGLFNTNVNENKNDEFIRKMIKKYKIDITGKIIN